MQYTHEDKPVGENIWPDDGATCINRGYLAVPATHSICHVVSNSYALRLWWLINSKSLLKILWYQCDDEIKTLKRNYLTNEWMNEWKVGSDCLSGMDRVHFSYLLLLILHLANGLSCERYSYYNLLSKRKRSRECDNLFIKDQHAGFI